MNLFQNWRAFSPSPRAGRAGGLAALALLGLFAAGAAQAQTINLSATNNTVTEGGMIIYSVRSTTQLAAGRIITIMWALEGGTASADDFATATSGSISLEQQRPGSAIVYNIRTNDDTEVEGDETVNLTIACTDNCDGVSLGTSQVTITITDNDTGFTVTGPANIAETDANADTGDYTITRSGIALAATITWSVHTTGGPLATDDFTNTSGTVTFTASDTSQTFALNVIGDDIAETDERFVFILGGGSFDFGPLLGITIADDDHATFTVTGPTALTETAANAETGDYTITRTGQEPAATVTVMWTVLPGADGVDFTDVSNMVEFLTTETVKTFRLNVVGDTTLEPPETFTLTLDPSGVHDAGADLAITITDNNGATFIVTGPATLAETDSDAMTGNYTITRHGAAVAGMVGWSITHGTTDDDDFSATSGTVTFTAGDDTRTFTLTVTGDNLAEGDETFTLNANPPDGELAGTAHSVTITDDDIEFTVTGPVTLAETDADASSGDYTITRNGGALTASADITWTLMHDATSGTSAADFTGATTGIVTFAAGDDSKTFALTITGDNASEGDEGFSLGLTTADYAVGADLSVTIADDDDDISFTLNAPANQAVEGSAPAFTVTYIAGDGSTALAAAVTMDVTVTNDVPNNSVLASPTFEMRAWDTDWEMSETLNSVQRGTAGNVTVRVTKVIPMGTAHNTVVNLDLPAVTNDNLAERREHFRVNVALNSPPAGTTVTPAFVQHTIAASDPIGLSVVAPAQPIDVTEGGSGGTVRVNFNIPAGVTWQRPFNATTIKIAYEANAAAMESPDITWDDVVSNSYAEIDFAGNDDDTPGLHRMFNDITITGVNASNFNANVATHEDFSITVRDDDPQSWVVTAVDPGGAVSANVQEDATAHTDPNAEGNAADSYFRILVWTDEALGPNVRARTVLTYCIYGTARGGVASDEDRDFTWPAGYDPDADVRSMNGNCASGSGTLTFAANAEERYRVPLVLNDDALNEAAETILIDTVSAVSDEGYRNVVEHDFYTGANSAATRTIQDNDDISVSIAVASSDADDMTDGIQVSEGRNAMFTVTLGGARGGSSSAVTVPYTIGGDVEAADLSGISSLMGNTFTIAANQGSAILAIPLADDADTASEALTVTLGEGSAGYTAAGTIARTTTPAGQSATVNVVTNADARALTLTRFDDSGRTMESPTDTVAETDTALMLYYRIGFANLAPTAFTRATPVTWTITHGTTSDDDFSATSGTVTFAMGATTAQNFAIAIAGDTINEASETFTVGLSLTNDLDDGGTNATATSDITITDNDDISVSIAVASPDTDDMTDGIQVGEGRSAMFTVTLGGADGGSSSAVTVPYTIGGDVEAADLSGISSLMGNTFTIAAGQGSAILAIPLAEDADTASEDLTVTLGEGSAGYTAAGTIARSTTTGQSATVKVVDRTDARTLTLIRFDDSGRTMESTATSVAETDAPLMLYYRIGFASGTPTAFTADTGVTWSITHGTTDDDDFSATSGTVTFAMGATAAQDFAIAIAGDTINEASETFTVGLSLTNSLDDGGTNATATSGITITDNDDISVSIAVASPDADDMTDGIQVDEGRSAMFTVTLGGADGGSSSAVTVPYTIGGDVEAADLSGISSLMGNTFTIAAGQGSAILAIPLANDADTASEDLTVTLGEGSTGYAAAGTIARGTAGQSATVKVVTPTAARALTLTTGATAAVDEGGDLVFNITVDGVDVTEAFDVTWTVTAGASAIAGARVDGTASASASTGTAAFTATAGAQTRILTLSTRDDADEEDAETVTVTLTDPCPASPPVCAVGGRPSDLGASVPSLRLIGATASGTINESDRPITLRLAAPAADLAEGTAANFMVSFTESVTTTAPVTAQWRITFPADGGAMTPVPATATDFGGTLSGSVSIPAGQSSANIAITATDDTLNESAERFIITLNAPGGGGAIAAPVLHNTDAVANADIAESDPVWGALRRKTGESGNVDEGDVVTFTAFIVTAGSDSAPAGVSGGDICIPFRNSGFAANPPPDNTAQSGPDFELAPENRFGCSGRAVSTLLPNDSGFEGSVIIPAGQSEMDFSIRVLLDGIDDPGQAMQVGTATPVEFRDGGSRRGAGPVERLNISATVRINNINTARTLSIAAATATADEGGNLTFSVTVAGAAVTESFDVAWTAAPAAEVATASGSVTFAPGATPLMQTITVAIADDAIEEMDETVTVTLTDPCPSSGTCNVGGRSGIAAGEHALFLPGESDSASGTINANDAPITLSLSAPAADLAEGTAANFSVEFTESVTTTAAVTADWTITFPAASAMVNPANTADFASLTGVVTIPAGQSSANIALTADADAVSEAAESFTLTLSNPASGGADTHPGLHSTDNAVAATIAASDPITVSIAADAASVNEGLNAEFTVTLAGANAGSAAAITVAYTASGTTDTPSDANGGSIVIAAGDTTGTVTLGIPLNAALGGTMTEMLSVALDTITVGAGGGAAAAAAAPDNSATTTVNYVDAAHAIAFDSPATTIAEGASATYTVSRGGPDITDGNNIVVSWTYAAGATSPAAADFMGDTVPAGGALTFTGSETSKTFIVATREDMLNEGGETFTLGLSATATVLNSESGVILGNAATVTITDDDAIAAVVSAATTSVTEGGSATVTVNLGAVPTTDVTVAYAIGATGATDDVDAVAADDLTDTSAGSIIIRAASDPPSGAIRIGIDADNRNESAETFTVTIAAADISGHLGTATVASGGARTFTIAASDPMTAAIAAPTPATVSEGQTAIFTVELTGASAGSAAATTVSYTVGGTTTDTPTDANSGSIAIAAGQTRGTIPIGIPISDTLGDSSPDQMLTVTLGAIATAAGGGAVTAAAAPGNAASVDVNYLSAAHFFSFANPATSIAEGDAATTTTYTVTRTGAALGGDTINVTWAFTAGSTEAADFGGGANPAGGTLAFTGTDANNTFSVTVANDNLAEGDETFTLTLSVANAAANGGISLPASGLGVTIADDSNDIIVVTISLGDGAAATVGEAASATFSAALSGAVRTADVVVPFNITGLDASEFDITMPAGFAASATGGNITFGTDGTVTATDSIDIVINLIGDTLNEPIEILTLSGGTISTAGGMARYGRNSFGDANSALAAVSDDDNLVVHLTRAATGAVDEGSSATFTVTLRDSGGGDGASAGIICVPFSVAVNDQQTPSNNAASGADIALVAPHNGLCGSRTTAVTPADSDGSATASVEIPAGDSQATFEILARNDNLDEGATAETISVTLGTPVGSGAGNLGSDTTAVTVPIANVNATPAMQADVNDDGSLDRNDAAIMYYAYAVRGLDADNTSDADLRHLLLRGLMPRSARGNDTAYQTALARALQLRMPQQGSRNDEGSRDALRRAVELR